jgi:hypothetical protein
MLVCACLGRQGRGEHAVERGGCRIGRTRRHRNQRQPRRIVGVLQEMTDERSREVGQGFLRRISGGPQPRQKYDIVETRERVLDQGFIAELS